MEHYCTAKQSAMSGTEIDLNSLDEAMLLALLLKGSAMKVSAVSVRRALDQDAACVTDAGIYQARRVIEIARLLTEKRAARKMLGRIVLNNPMAVRNYLVARLGTARREEFGCLYLDASFAVICYEQTAIGSISEVTCHPREIARRCIELDAESCLLVHNHPTSNIRVSTADIELTKGVKQALFTLGIALHDHYLIAGDQCISIRDVEPDAFVTA